MTRTDTQTQQAEWLQRNRQTLAHEFHRISAALRLYAHRTHPQAAPEHREADMAAQEALAAAATQPPDGAAPPALALLCESFGLTAFERDVLLLCAGVELEGEVLAACGAAQGGAGRGSVNFALALAALPGAHFSAVLPGAPLRRAQLVELQGSLMQGALRINEQILHYLLGFDVLDERLTELEEGGPHQLKQNPMLVPSHHAAAERIVALLTDEQSDAENLIQVVGDDDSARQAVVAAACKQLGLRLLCLRVVDISANPEERKSWTALWNRSALLHDLALLVCYSDDDPSESVKAAAALLRRLEGPLFVSSAEPVRIAGRESFQIDLPQPTLVERQELWRTALGPLAPKSPGAIEVLAAHFQLGAQAMAAACDLARLASATPAQFPTQLWDACRQQARPRLSDLAQRIEPQSGWDELVLPDAQGQILRALASQARHRFQVYHKWGFSQKTQRGLGLSALFVGSSGTGKTLAAEVLAHELRLDLYRIDLSQVVSKYIGETEKNLRRVFDAAERGGAVLLFDEADALFGKRSEVKDSHDRHANIEVSYLLQRMEAYSGLSILTSNMKGALDSAFLRRIRFIVQFPFPDPAQRAELWRRAFPKSAPTQGLQWDKLAKLQVAGGNIRNIALSAAFLAAEHGQPVSMAHLLHAARLECAKLEKPLSDAETGGWT